MFAEVINSLQVIPFQSASLFIEFDESTQSDKSWIYDLLKTFENARISEYRLTSFQDWKRESDRILHSDSFKPDLIFLLNYEDHIFMQPTALQFQEYAEALLIVDRSSKLPVIGLLSHFPESINRLQVARSLRLLRISNYGNLVPCPNPIGAVLVSPSVFSDWWKTDFTNGKRFVSLENPFGDSLLDPKLYALLPNFELLRHMDGYEHVGINHEMCPPILNIDLKNSRKFPNFQRTLRFEGDVLGLYKKKTDLNNYLLSEEFSHSKKEKTRTLIFKSSMLRLNPMTILWLRRTHSITFSELSRSLLELFIFLPFYRILLLKSFAYLPFYLLLFIIAPFLHAYNRILQNDKLLRFLLDGASSGYFKILKWKIKSRIN